MKTLAEKENSHSTAKTSSPRAADYLPNPEGMDMMRELLRQGSIAAKLNIGSPSDPAEIEADRVADAVINHSFESTSYQESRTPVARKKETGSQASLSSISLDIANGSSRGLDTLEQNYFEQRFNQDFSDIRIYEDTAASTAASAINARAFTHGSDIYLKQGEYSFGSTNGKRLLAHELAHTLQPDTGTIRRWGGSEHLAFGNIAGGMVADHYGEYMQALEDLSGSRESSLQISTGRLIEGKEKNVRKGHGGSTASMYISYLDVYPLANYKKQMLLGTATELSGDYRESAEDLAASYYGKETLGMLNPKYLGLALTNVNHFFPLAVKEWEANHDTAMASARDANDLFGKAATDKNNRTSYMRLGNTLLESAMQYEAFGLHFLQDAFASGHQYPRAFDLTQPTEFTLSRESSTDSSEEEWETVYSFSDVSLLQKQGWTLRDAGDKSTGHKAMIYHDLLCELEQGIHLKYRGSTPFHGDGTGNAKDYPVAVETYNSMAQVLCTAFSASMDKVGAEKPKAPTGPDVQAIMEDPVAAPIWYAMEYDLARNFKANIGNPKVNKDRQTDSGMVTYNQDSVMKEWERIHPGKKSVLSRPEKPKGADFYIEGIGDPGLLFTDLDKQIVDYLKKHKFPSTVSPNLCAYIINLLIGKVPLVRGVCGDDEEGAILKILQVQSVDNFFKIILKVGIPRLDTGIDGSEWTQLLYMIQRHLPGKAKDYDSMNKLIRGLIATNCWDQEERLIISALLAMDNAVCRRVVNDIGFSRFDSGIDGAEWDEFISVIMSKLPSGENAGAYKIAQEKNDDAARWAVARLWSYGYPAVGRHVSPAECIGLIRALLYGSCGDDDEDAIVLIVRYMVSIGKKGLINSWIGEDTMDSGVDGSQWTKVAYLMGW